MKPKDLVRHELIGLKVMVSDAKNKSLIGIKGTIIDETKETLTIETEKGNKKIIKNQTTLDFEAEGKKIRVDGAILAKRPEERTKKV